MVFQKKFLYNNVNKSNIYHINTGRTFKEENENYPIRG